ncbi:MAG: PKD domain-containing protein, partial [Chloroflexota bacterium]
MSPIPGNVVAGNIQVLGAAIHPQFLQYQLEYGPDPNPGNLWFPATGIVQTPVLNGLLGIWNTSVVQDSIYQLRLRVTLRDGSNLATVVNNIRVQNQAPTPIPSNTPNVPRPIAAFTQDRASGLAPLVVRFTNQSSGTISSYSWSFGDGGSSPQANPTYTFRNPGVYTVTLYVSGPSGTSNVSRQINVQSPTTPIAGFTQDKTSGPSPLTVNFTNQSTGTISSYAWVFGDGATSADQNPSHQFIAVGTYNVIFTVTGPGGTSSVTRKITVEDPVIPAPEAAFTSDKTSGDAPLLVQFANQSTGQVTNYAWDFGDKQTSADTNPAHTFTDAGTYTVTLTAIGPGGQKIAQSTITVNKPPTAPVAAFTEDKISGDAPLRIQFTDQSTGDIATYAWDFGDGNTNSDKNPAHTFNTAGTYTVKLTVSGSGGSSSTEVAVNATQPLALPDAAFTQDVSSGNVPFNVQFTNQSTGENMTFAWDFGDGSPISSDMNPLHTYSNQGNYTVTLTVSNSSGTDMSQTSITANTAPPPVAVKPVASFAPSTTAGDTPLNVTFDASSSTGDITGYSWAFGDNVGVSTDANPSYAYSTPGTYVVTLVVSGPGGDSDPFTATITVNTPAPVAVKPVASFAPSTTAGDAPLNVTFDASSSTGDITGYSWAFGDNVGVSTDANPSYAYSTPGTYVVTL